MKLDKLFIRMCRASEEIQEFKPPTDTEGNWWYQEDKGKYLPAGVYCVGQAGDEYPASKKDVWLPTQAQLQGMLNRYWKGHWAQLFLLWYTIEDIENYGECSSFEQLWLMLVMNKLYGKVWSRSAWVLR